MNQVNEVLDLLVKSQSYLQPNLQGMPNILRCLLVSGREIVVETPETTLLGGVAGYINCVPSGESQNLYIWTLDPELFKSEYYLNYKKQVVDSVLAEIKTAHGVIKDLTARLSEVLGA